MPKGIYKRITKVQKHGMYGTRFYNIFKSIKSRCNNKNTREYNFYGGRGIKIIWIDFLSFKNDMYESYLEHLKNNSYTSIDRYPDKNGNYCKENCRWATQKEQTRNTRRNDLFTFKGQTKCLSEWAEELGIKRATLWTRLHRDKWSVERAFTNFARGHTK